VAASVRIEDEAFSDTRIELLGSLLGTSKYDALGRLAYIWRQATATGRHILPESVVSHICDVEKLVNAKLAVKTITGVRIRGARGRIEWLGRARESGRLNGPKGAEFGRLGGRPPKTPPKPPGGVMENPLPAPAPAPAPALKTEENTETTPTPPLALVPIVPGADFLAAWNGAAVDAGWRLCRNLSPKRLKALRARQADPFWREHWRAAIDRAKPIPGLRGSNDRNWRANVDWFLRPETVTRITEGFYDDWQPPRDRSRAGSATEYAKRTLGGIL
jgi:hypothetical protein